MDARPATGRLLREIAGMVCGILFFGPALAHGNTTNQIPFAETFEAYPNNTFLADSAGWYAADTEALIVETNSYADGYLGEFPIADDWALNPHAKVLHVTAPATNMVQTDTVGLHTNWVDMMILPRFWQDETPPVVASNVQVGIYFNSNGNINVYAQYQAGQSGWLEIDNPVGSNQWIRLTVAISYGVSGLSFFQLQLNNSRYLTHPLAWSEPVIPPSSLNGTWFPCNDTSRFYMSGVGFAGSSFIDDLVVTNGQPAITPVYTIFTSVAPGGLLTVGGQEVIGNLTVVSNSPAAFAIGNKEGYTVTNVVRDAVNLGVTNAVSWPNVTQNHTLAVQTKAEPRTLTIVSPYGSPNPATGSYNLLYDAPITATLAGSPIVLGVGTQRACVGWSRTVSDPDSGTGTNTLFYLRGPTTSDVTTVTWNWQDEVLLDTTVDGYGTVSVSDSWYPTGNVQVAIVAATNGYSVFTGWSGATNGCTITGETITVVMDQARDITAHFSGGVAPNGTPITWMIEQGVSNDFDTAEVDDTDEDGKVLWEEYQTGTDPNNSNSVFRVIHQESFNTSNKVVFYGTTNTGITTPFGMNRANKLLPTTLWTLVDDNIPRDATGTNVWWDFDVASSNVFLYMPVATNGAN